MWTVTSPRLSKPPTLDGLLSVGGYLAVCCALVAAVATVADWRADQRHETWRRATAVVEWCNVASVHSRIRNAGGREWHLECSARLDAGGQTSPVRVRSHSVKRASDVRKIGRSGTERERTSPCASIRISRAR